MKHAILAIGLLAGTIVGAGIFSLPYVFNRLGIGLGVIYLVAFSLIYFFVHWRYAQVLHTNQAGHHFFYFAKKYFKPWIARFASLIVLGELLFVMTVYLILAKSFANIAFDGFGIGAVLVFWVLGSVLVFARASWLGVAQIIGLGGILFITLLIVFFGGIGSVSLPLMKPIDLSVLLLPFGPLLFAFGARPAIPKVYELYRSIREKQRFSLKRVIFWGSILPIGLYLLFVVAVLRLVPNVSPDTVSSLSFLSPEVLLLMGIIGLLTLWTSYFIIGGNVFDILRTDVFRSRVLSGVVAVFVPLVLYLAGIQNFLEAVSITGGVFLALEAVFVTIMWAKAEPRRHLVLVTAPFYIIFTIGAVYEIVRLVF